MIDVARSRKRLLDMERKLEERTNREIEAGREARIESPGDAGDSSVSDTSVSEEFTQAELNSAILQQVRDALRRIDNGTYGKCVVDGKPIERKRLDAIPWAQYCAKHQALLEAAGTQRTWTL